MRKVLSAISISLLVLMISAAGICAQEKVIEKSGKKPAWVNSVEKGYIIEMGHGTTADEAKEKAMLQIKESMIRSVADLVSSSTTMTSIVKMTNNKSQINDDFTTAVRSRTAKMPFIKGISVSKASDFYWEKVKDPKTGAVSVNYHIKYPFPNSELNAIIAEFEKDMKEKAMMVEALCQPAANSTNLDEIVQKFRELLSLIPQLEEPVKTNALVCEATYRNLLKSLSILSTASSAGNLSYIISSGGKTFRSTSKPLIKSNCAGNFTFTTSADTSKIGYSYNGCYESQANKVSVEYHFEDITMKSEFPFEIGAGKIEFSLSDGVSITETDGDSLSIRQCQVRVNLNLKFATGFIVKRITLELPGASPVRFEGLSIKVSGKGLHAISAEGSAMIRKSTVSSRQGLGNQASGSIEYFDPMSGTTAVYKFYNEKTDIRLLQQ
ncbi:MAG: hypothetical protein WCO02_04365 [Bacteroidota bacterium]